MDQDTVTLADVEASIAATLDPLRQQLRAVESRERLILSDLIATREVKARLQSTLRKLDPSMPGPGRRKGQGGQPQTMSQRKATAERLATVAARKAIAEVAAANPDGFTRTKIGTQMKADGNPIGDVRLARIIDGLHSSGELTLHKIVTGGNKSYLRTEDLNGSPRQAD